MLNTILILSAFVLLATACWPSPRLQHLLLLLLSTLLRLALLALVISAAVLALCHEPVPAPILSLPLSDLANVPVPASWLLAATVVTLTTLPLLVFLDFARRLAGHTADMRSLPTRLADLARRLRKEMADAGETSASTLPESRRQQMQAALELLNLTGQAEPPAQRQLADFLR